MVYIIKTKMPFCLKLITLTSIMLVTGFHSARTQNLSDLYSELESNNKELQSYDKQQESILANAEQFVWLPDPEFGIGVFPSPVETRLGSQLFRASVMQMIPNKGISRQQKANMELSSLPIADKKDLKLLQKRFEIKKNWLAFYKLDRTQIIISQNLELLKSLEKIALGKIESGKGRMSEVLIVQIKMKEITERINIISEQKLIPVNNINRILNREIDQSLESNEDLAFPDINMDKEDFYLSVLKSHPKISILNNQKEIARSAIQLSEYAQKPVFGVGMDYIYVNGRTDMDPKGNGRDIAQLKAVMRIPINKNPYSARDKANLIKIEGFELQEQGVAHELLQQINNAYHEFELAKREYDLAESQLITIRSAINLLEKEYSSESSGFENLIAMEMEIIKYDKSILESIIKAYDALNVLENLSL